MAFGLSRHLGAHKSDARCVTGCNGLVASGGRDSVLKLWLSGGEAFSAQEAKWVNAVTSFAPGLLKSCIHGGIVTGSQDGFIRIYRIEQEQLHLQHTLHAHSAPVCSLSWLAVRDGMQLLSGGWDAVAKVWDFHHVDDSASLATTLAGHENNVCVLGLSNGDIITGSSGLRDEAVDCVTGYQLRVWREALVVQAITELDGGHKSAIRDLAAIPYGPSAGRCGAFASASNDGTVCVWHSNEGSAALAQYVRAVVLAVPSESFVFSVCYMAPNKIDTSINGTIFTADDSGELCVFDLSVSSPPEKTQSGALLPVQRIRHPKTLWSVAIIAGTESPQIGATGLASEACGEEAFALATACADGTVRIFSADSALHLPQAEQQTSFNPQPEPLPPAAEDYAMSATLPSASERGRFNGAQLGAISLFLDDDESSVTVTSSAAAVVAFLWSDSHGGDGAGWVKLGQVFDPVRLESISDEQTLPRKQELDGELFDQLIPVEVDSASRGQLNLLLGVNIGDDPQSVAANFCQKHGLGDEYIPQIAFFVEANM